MASNVLDLPDDVLSGPDRITLNFWEIINEPTFIKYFHESESQHINLLLPIYLSQDPDYGKKIIAPLKFTCNIPESNLALLIYPLGSPNPTLRGKIELINTKTNNKCYIAIKKEGKKVSFIIPSPLTCIPRKNELESKINDTDTTFFISNMNNFLNKYVFFVDTIINTITSDAQQFVVDFPKDGDIFIPKIFPIFIKKNSDVCDSKECLLCAIHNDYDFNTFIYKKNKYSIYRTTIPIVENYFPEIGYSHIGWDLLFSDFRLVYFTRSNLQLNNIIAIMCIGMTMYLYSSDKNIAKQLYDAKVSYELYKKALWKDYEWLLKRDSDYIHDENYQFMDEHYLFNKDKDLPTHYLISIPRWNKDFFSVFEYNDKVKSIKNLQKLVELKKIQIMILNRASDPIFKATRLDYLTKLLDRLLEFPSYNCDEIIFENAEQNKLLDKVYYDHKILREICSILKSKSDAKKSEILKLLNPTFKDEWGHTGAMSKPAFTYKVIKTIAQQQEEHLRKLEIIFNLLKINLFHPLHTDVQYYPVHYSYKSYPIVQFYPLPDDSAKKKYLKYKNKYLILKQQLANKSNI